MEPPYTERYVRWCERSGVSHPLLLDYRNVYLCSGRTQYSHEKEPKIRQVGNILKRQLDKTLTMTSPTFTINMYILHFWKYYIAKSLGACCMLSLNNVHADT
jgi:hypothetical protein